MDSSGRRTWKGAASYRKTIKERNKTTSVDYQQTLDKIMTNRYINQQPFVRFVSQMGEMIHTPQAKTPHPNRHSYIKLPFYTHMHSRLRINKRK